MHSLKPHSCIAKIALTPLSPEHRFAPSSLPPPVAAVVRARHFAPVPRKPKRRPIQRHACSRKRVVMATPCLDASTIGGQIEKTKGPGSRIPCGLGSFFLIHRFISQRCPFKKCPLHAALLAVTLWIPISTNVSKTRGYARTCLKSQGPDPTALGSRGVRLVKWRAIECDQKKTRKKRKGRERERAHACVNVDVNVCASK